MSVVELFAFSETCCVWKYRKYTGMNLSFYNVCPSAFFGWWCLLQYSPLFTHCNCTWILKKFKYSNLLTYVSSSAYQPLSRIFLIKEYNRTYFNHHLQSTIIIAKYVLVLMSCCCHWWCYSIRHSRYPWKFTQSQYARKGYPTQPCKIIIKNFICWPGARQVADPVDVIWLNHMQFQ